MSYFRYYRLILHPAELATITGVRTRHAERYPSARRAAEEMYDRARRALGNPIIPPEGMRVDVQYMRCIGGAYTAPSYATCERYDWQGWHK